MSRVTWDEQDCAEIPLLASEKIMRLRAENKALKKAAGILEKEMSTEINRQAEHICKLEQSRDELLAAAKIVYRASDGGKYSVRAEIGVLEKPIQKAEEKSK